MYIGGVFWDLLELWWFKDQYLDHVIVTTNFYFISAHNGLNVIEDPYFRRGLSNPAMTEHDNVMHSPEKGNKAD